MNRSHSVLAALGALAAGSMVLATPACSAIVQPDPARLGGTDAGGGLFDGGDRTDGGLIDGGPTDTGPARDAPLPDAGVPECTLASECVDAVACTTDDCVAGACTSTADDSACATGERCNLVTGCVPVVCASDAECADGNACNGVERCAPGSAGADPRTGCANGPALVCNDGINCTADACSPATGCTNRRDDAACDDGVRCTMDRCAATAGPSGCENLPMDSVCATDVCVTGARCDAALGCTGGAPRDCRDGNVCTADACDALAVGSCAHVPIDADMDGAPARMVGTMACAGGTDCNDMNPGVRPGAPEVCGNGIDDNCAGGVDEGCVLPTGENCATARPLALMGDPAATRTARFNGMFSSFADDYTTSCGQSGGRDVVLSLTIDRPSDVRLETSGVPIDTVLAVSAPACDPMAFDAACNDDADPGGPLTSRMWLHRIAPPSGGGPITVYVLVDGYTASQTGGFQLDVTVTPIHPDSCSAVEQLDITGGGLVLGYSGGLATVVGGQRGSCDPDFVDTDVEAGIFRLTAPGDGVLSSLTARSPSFPETLYVRTGNCSSGTEPAGACNIGGDLRDVPVAAGTRAWVIFDGVPAGTVAALPYTLEYDP